MRTRGSQVFFVESNVVYPISAASWWVANPATGGNLTVSMLAPEPVEYSVDNGTWVAAGPGDFTISGLTDGPRIGVRLRRPGGPSSATKYATPSAATTTSPITDLAGQAILDLSGAGISDMPVAA